MVGFLDYVYSETAVYFTSHPHLIIMDICKHTDESESSYIKKKKKKSCGSGINLYDFFLMYGTIL